MSIYVGNLPYQIAKDNLKEVFVKHDKVSQIQVVVGRKIAIGGGFSHLSNIDSKRKKMQ